MGLLDMRSGYSPKIRFLAIRFIPSIPFILELEGQCCTYTYRVARSGEWRGKVEVGWRSATVAWDKL
jgi:hypothetical protein